MAFGTKTRIGAVVVTSWAGSVWAQYWERIDGGDARRGRRLASPEERHGPFIV